MAHLDLHIFIVLSFPTRLPAYTRTGALRARERHEELRPHPSLYMISSRSCMRNILTCDSPRACGDVLRSRLPLPSLTTPLQSCFSVLAFIHYQDVQANQVSSCLLLEFDPMQHPISCSLFPRGTQTGILSAGNGLCYSINTCFSSFGSRFSLSACLYS